MSPIRSPWPALLALALLAACSDDSTDPTADSGPPPADLRADGAPPTPDAAPDSGLPPDAWVPAAAPKVTMPRASVLPAEVGVLYNDKDPVSTAIAAYYLKKRGIPQKNLVKLSFTATAAVMKEADFKPLKAQVDKALGPDVQVLALTWRLPYRVGCMGITSAFALGYDAKYCNDKSISGKSCAATASVSYFMSKTTRPYTDHQLRPAMALAAMTEAEGKKLVDRGLAAEGTLPPGKGYLVRTTDKARSVRYPQFPTTVAQHNHPGGIALEYIDNSAGAAGSNVIANKKDVLFYFTGLTTVASLATNTYLPGAVADHLTSYGGRITSPGSGGQMSILRWLEAGATGSYGTTVEPCNYTYKFPDTRVLLPFYFLGNTLVEAYWKSVRWPGEGHFIGDPLARPWGTKVSFDKATQALTIKTSTLQPMVPYKLYGESPTTGKEELVKDNIKITRYEMIELKVAPVKHKSYRLTP